MNRALVAGIAVVVLVVGAVAGWWLLRDEGQSTYIVGRGSIDVTIETIGKVQSTGSSTVRSAVAGEIETVAVSPGDVVTAGDILVVLVDTTFERAVAAANQQLEDAEFALQLAERALHEEPDNEGRRLAVIQAAQRVEAAEVVLFDAAQALANSIITAPRDGTILEVPVREGDLVNRTAPVAILFSREDLEVIATVDELDLANVRIGAEATLRLDAYPDREIAGTVLATAPAAREQGGATVFSTTISLDLPDDLDIRPGMNTDVTIITEARDDVLLIPQRAIRTVGNRSFVQVVRDGKQVEQEVVLGYRSGGQAEVVSGLAEGERIILP